MPLIYHRHRIYCTESDGFMFSFTSQRKKVRYLQGGPQKLAHFLYAL